MLEGGNRPIELILPVVALSYDGKNRECRSTRRVQQRVLDSTCKAGLIVVFRISLSPCCNTVPQLCQVQVSKTTRVTSIPSPIKRFKKKKQLHTPDTLMLLSHAVCFPSRTMASSLLPFFKSPKASQADPAQPGMRLHQLGTKKTTLVPSSPPPLHLFPLIARSSRQTRHQGTAPAANPARPTRIPLLKTPRATSRSPPLYCAASSFSLAFSSSVRSAYHSWNPATFSRAALTKNSVR